MNEGNYITLGALGFAFIVLGIIITANPSDHYYAPTFMVEIFSVVFWIGMLMMLSLPVIAILSHIANRDSEDERLYYRRSGYLESDYSNQEDNQPSGSFSKSTGRFRID